MAYPFWTALGIHSKEYKKLSNEDSVIQFLQKNLPGEGQYAVPGINENASREEMEKADAAMRGKPWAIISYHQSYNADMLKNILRGFLVDIIAVFMIAWIITRNPSPKFSDGFLTTLFVGLAGYLFIPYSAHIWYQTPDATTNLIDVIMCWGLCGLWLGKYLKNQ